MMSKGCPTVFYPGFFRAFLFRPFVHVCAPVYMCICDPKHLIGWKSEDMFLESVFFLTDAGPGRHCL